MSDADAHKQGIGVESLGTVRDTLIEPPIPVAFATIQTGSSSMICRSFPPPETSDVSRLEQLHDRNFKRPNGSNGTDVD
ncbi:hypothetical protein AGR3A_Cc20208 [Agrobacterium tomkonis CFBP 6623]|uniref:Uncharacterized protein n=1 Tax=Agrobacterium tomkonis CFBP 6623 TaxID=1183432 RepID=A0A1S7P6S4_9HYPH|nr:hypothetical protein AGR3A_Cc20208 [Agrobacterium tomkonis CFBP 6623]